MCKENEGEVKEEKMKPKKVSLWAMIIAGITPLFFNVYILIVKDGKILTKEEQYSICFLAGFLLICFSPIYVNMILDKIVDIITAIKTKSVDAMVNKMIEKDKK